MLSVIGGLWVMSGSDPLSAQANSVSRAIAPETVAPGGTVTVTITTGIQFIPIEETLPTGFTYVGTSLVDDTQVAPSGQVVTFTVIDETSFTYTVTASSTPGAHGFEGTYRDLSRATHPVTGETHVTVEGADTGGTTPQPTATAAPAATAAPSLADSSIIAAVNGDAAIIGPLAMIIVKDQGSAAAVPPVTAQPNATPPVAGFANPAIMNGGPMYTPDRFHRTVASICGSWDSRRGLCHSSREWR